MAYALFAALLVGAYFSRVAPREWQLQSGRQTQLRATMKAHKQGAPLLTASCAGAHLAPRAIVHPGKWCPVGLSDDKGAYLFLPYVADVTGDTEPGLAFRALFIVAFAAAAFAFVRSFYALFGTLAGLAAPLLLVLAQRTLGYPDIYWVGGWAVLALIPPLIVLARSRLRVFLASAVGLLVLASAAGAVRSQAGLPVLLAAWVLLGMRRDLRVLVRIGIAVALVLPYMSVSTGVMHAVASARDSRDDVAVPRDFPSGHVVWHSLYIGLGYLPNDHQIWWIDAVGQKKAQQLNPGVVYTSDAYEKTLRGAVQDLVRDDPGFVLGMESRKLVVAGAHVALALALLSVVLALLWPNGAARELLVRTLAPLLPVVPAGLVGAVFGLPMVEYEQTWRSCVWLMLAFAVATALWLFGVEGFRRPRLSRAAAAAGVAGLVVAIALALAGPPIESDAAAWLKKGLAEFS